MSDAVTNFLIQCCGYWGPFWNGGNQWSAWCSYLSFFRHVAQLQIDYAGWSHYESATIHAGPRFMHATFCMVSDRPEYIHRDSRNRPHRSNGPFCRWRDGWSLYYVHGVRVPVDIIERPETITVARIESERNAEVRRVMVERYGTGKYLLDSGAKLLHEDRFGKLYRKEQEGDEPIVMVHVRNSTPEPDGTVHEFFLRVHPELRPIRAGKIVGEPQAMTARNAVGSTFGKRGEEYAPMVET